MFFPVIDDSLNDRIQNRIKKLTDRLAAKEPIILQRFASRGHTDKEVGRYINNIEYHDKKINATCKIDATGSIRIDEILELLDIAPEELSGPVKRQSVQWQEN